MRHLPVSESDKWWYLESARASLLNRVTSHRRQIAASNDHQSTEVVISEGWLAPQPPDMKTIFNLGGAPKARCVCYENAAEAVEALVQVDSRLAAGRARIRPSRERGPHPREPQGQCRRACAPPPPAPSFRRPRR